MPDYMTKETMAYYQEELKRWLQENGPAIKDDFQEGLGWGDTTTSKIVQSQPEWLVVVGIVKSKTRTGRKSLFHCEGEHVTGKCGTCGRKIFHPSFKSRDLCHRCTRKQNNPNKVKLKAEAEGHDIRGINPYDPCDAPPGSLMKMRTLAARYAHGLPLWDRRDEDEQTPDSTWTGPPEYDTNDSDEDDWD